MMLLHLHCSDDCSCNCPQVLSQKGLCACRCVVHDFDLCVDLAAVHNTLGSDSSSNVQGQHNDTSQNLLTSKGRRVPGLDVLRRRRDLSPGFLR